MPLKRSFVQPETCRICGLEPKNSALALPLLNMFPTQPCRGDAGEVVLTRAGRLEVTCARACHDHDGPADSLNSPLPLLVENVDPHGASRSLEPHRISDGLPFRSRPSAVAV